jgi:tRNA threonylcarbamoyladenosine biosynthesis protein TsaB
LTSARDTESPLVLGIETATGVCGAAVAEGGAIKAEAFLDVGLTHSSKLLELVRRVLADASVTLSQVDALAVSVGPGSFTGVRIGVGTAMGLAEGSGLPIVPVPTLDALAWAQRPFKGIVCAFVDARRGEVYYCFYELEWDRLNRLADYTVREPGAMLEDVGRELERRPGGAQVVLAGPRELLQGSLEGSSVGPGPEGADAQPARVLFAPSERAAPRPAAVAALGAELYHKGKAVPLNEVDPIYVRRSDAELRTKKSRTP